jgi:hypothetical protein
MLEKVQMAAQLYCNGPKAKYTRVVYKEVPVQRGKWKTLYISNTEYWIGTS